MITLISPYYHFLPRIKLVRRNLLALNFCTLLLFLKLPDYIPHLKVKQSRNQIWFWQVHPIIFIFFPNQFSNFEFCYMNSNLEKKSSKNWRIGYSCIIKTGFQIVLHLKGLLDEIFLMKKSFAVQRQGKVWHIFQMRLFCVGGIESKLPMLVRGGVGERWEVGGGRWEGGYGS